MKHKHSKCKNLFSHSILMAPPAPHTQIHLSPYCHFPNLILPQFSVSFVLDSDLKNKTLTLVSVFLAVLVLLQPAFRLIL